MNWNQKKIKDVIKEYGNLFWLPVLFLFIILPNIVYYKVYESRLADYAWTPQNGGLSVDFYLYYKQFFFCFLGGVMLILGIVLLWKNKTPAFKEKKQWLSLLPLAIYLVLSLFAALLSPYRETALTGCDQQFESVFVLLGYGITCIYMLLLVKTKRDVEKTGAIIYIATIVLAVLGLLQSFGFNPFRFEWFQRLITPAGYYEATGGITGAFEEGYISLFSFNPNYAGVLLCMCSLFCFVQLVTEKNKKKFLWKLLLWIAVWIGLIHTQSDAGILVSVALSILVLVFFTKPMKKLRYWILGIGGTLVVLVLLLFCIGNNPVHRALASRLQNEPNPLSKMTTEPDGVHITYEGLSFVLTAEYTFTEPVEDSEYLIRMFYENGQELVLNVDNNGNFVPAEAALQHMVLTPAALENNIPVIILQLDNYTWYFLQDANGYYLLNEYNNIEILKETERIGFEGYEMLATFRGLTWSQTLPLLKDTWLLGTGASTFAHVYPQSNYKDQIFYQGGVMASTRPHSFYLQVAVESGVVALVSLLVFFGWYLISSIKRYWNADVTESTARIGLACFVMVAGYLVCMLTNDSMIVTAPVFWGVLGLGIVVNSKR